MVNLQNIQVKVNNSFQTVCPFPIGFVYSSMNSTSPASIFGGSWTEIKGRFPYFNAGTATGGVNSQVLKIEQLPKHIHRTYVGWGSGDAISVLTYNAGTGNKWGGTVGVYDNDTGDVVRPGIGKVVDGATKAVNNMPAYQTLYRMVQDSVAPLLEAM